MSEIHERRSRREGAARDALRKELSDFLFLYERLMEHVREDARTLVSEEEIIANVVAYGMCDRHYHGDENEYGFRNREHMLSILEHLKEVWAGEIDVEITPQRGEVKVIYRAHE